MFDDLIEKLYKKIARDPCKFCLVRATCLDKYGSVTKPCDQYDNYSKWKNKLTDFGDSFETWLVIAIIICGLLFILLTLLFGFWKWVEIILKCFHVY